MKNNTLMVVCLCLITCMVAGGSCKKDKSNKEDQLPPITQTGANTFGCLVNGKVYLNKGYINPYPNYRLIIDPSFAEGSFSLRVYSIENSIITNMTINSDTIKGIGIYPITDTGKTRFIFSKIYTDYSQYICETPYTGNFNRSGVLKIIKYDLVNGVFAGEFELLFSNSNCGIGEPIRITKGRFDKKL